MLISPVSPLLQPLSLLILCATMARLAGAQYQGYGYGMAHGPAYSYGGDESQMMDGGEIVDERPRVQLGIRLKIPAIRFELPRVSLPKVTISAKIRQPDRPRTINLPEINLDTSSRVVPPGAIGAQGAELGRTQVRSYGSRGGAGGGSGYSGSAMSSYGPSSAEGERTQSFTFSTDEERTPPMNVYRSYKPNQSAYSSTNIHPSYLAVQQNNILRRPVVQTTHTKDSEAGFERASSRSYATESRNVNRSAGKKAVSPGNQHKMNAARYGFF